MAVTVRLDNVRVVNQGSGQGSGDFTSGTFSTVAGTLLVAIVKADAQPFGGSSGMNTAFRAITPTTSGTTWVTKVQTDTSTQAYTGMVGIYVADSPGTGSGRTFSMAGTGSWDTDTNCVDVTVLEIDGGMAVAASQSGKTGNSFSISAAPRDPGAQTLNWTGGGSAGTGGWLVAAFAGDGDNATSVTVGTSYTGSTSRSPGGSGLGPYLASRDEWIASSGQSSTAWGDLASAAAIYDYGLAAIEIITAPTGTDITVTVIAATAGIGSVTVTASATKTTTAVAATAGIGSVTVATATGPTPTAIAAVAAVNAPTITATATKTATAVAATAGIGTVTVVTPADYPIPTSISGRKILDQNGAVFLMLNMSSWGMPQRLSNSEITTALEGIAAAGFNAVMIDCAGAENSNIGSGWTAYTNKAGASFFTGTPWASSLGSAWSSTDWVVSEAARLGMIVNMSMFGGFGSTGAKADWTAVTNAQMRTTGSAIATRYLSAENIVWHLEIDGTEGPGSTVGARAEALAQGINDVEGSARPFRWMEPDNSQVSINSAGWRGTTQWQIPVNGTYVYGDNSATYEETTLGQAVVPWGDVEPPYHGATHYSGDESQQLRERTAAVFLLGGSYINYGDEAWWPFGADGVFSVGWAWTDVPTLDQTLQAGYIFGLAQLYCADVNYTNQGATFVTTGLGTGDTKAAAGASNNAALAYFPNSRTIQVDTTILVGSANVRLRWWDPVTGTWDSTIASSEAQQTGRSVTMPAARGDGTRDFVLVVDVVAIPATAIAATAGIGSPTLLTSIAITPTAIAATAGIGTVTRTATATPTTTAVAAVAAVNTPTVTTTANPTPTAIAATAGVGTVTVNTGSSNTATPAAIAAVAAVNAPTITATATKTATAVAATAAIGGASPVTGTFVTPTAIAATAGVNAITLTASGLALLTTVAAVARVVVPSFPTFGPNITGPLKTRRTQPLRASQRTQSLRRTRRQT